MIELRRKNELKQFLNRPKFLIMKKNYSQSYWILIFSLFFVNSLLCQLTVAPLSCYPQYNSVAEMNAAAVTSSGATPFATWKGVYDYAIANSISTIDFVTGTYEVGVSTNWGDSDGGFILQSGMTVNGNGSVIDAAGISNMAFATLSSNATINGFTFYKLSGTTTSGAITVPSSADNWTISNCNFDNCNKNTDAVSVAMGSTSTGIIIGCNFYRNSNPAATHPPGEPDNTGTATASAMAITGSLTSDLNIINSTFSCNFRNVGGGAIQIHDDVHVDFSGCTFERNEANVSDGGAVSIRNGAEVSFMDTNFYNNFGSGSASNTPRGGALDIRSGSDVTITGGKFYGNTVNDNGGAIHVEGSSSAGSECNVSINGAIFEANTANSSSKDGGAIFMRSYYDVDITNCLFVNNECADNGGAIGTYTNSQAPRNLDISQCSIVDSNSGSGEGAIDEGTSAAVTNLTNIAYWMNSPLNKEGSFETNTGESTGTALTEANNYQTGGTAGWTGTYNSATGATDCPSTTAVANDCEDQGSISGVTFDDSDNNGINDVDLLDGVLVELFNCDGTPTGQSVITGLSGEFYFGGLANGSCFYVVFTAPGGFDPTIQDASGADSTNDSDVSSATNQSPQITINTIANSIDMDDDTSNETHYITVDAGFTSAPLPVEISYFKANAKDCETILDWETASEEGNDYFEIERSTDGRSFESLGIVEGKGTSFSVHQYSFTDNSPRVNSENYYRLKQVDFDGTVAYSQIRIIDHQGCKDQFGIQSFYPNPFNEELIIELGTFENETQVTLELIDVLGSQIKFEKIQIESNGKIKIPTESLNVGVYFVRVMVDGNLFTIKTCKQK